LLLGLIALVAVWISFARRPTAARFPAAAAAAVIAFVAFGKILSPQYLVWLVPLVAILPKRAVTAGTLLAAALVLTHLWFPSRYGEVVALEPVTWLVLARNLVLVALFAVVASTLRADESGAPS
jgi:L-cystine uptake protein TcyP (sodium:dicarboxylate symporter family)